MKNGYDEIISLQGYNCGSCALPFLSLPPYLETKFHFNRFLLSKIWPRTGNTYEKLLWGDNSIHIQGIICVLCTVLSRLAIYLYIINYTDS